MQQTNKELYGRKLPRVLGLTLSPRYLSRSLNVLIYLNTLNLTLSRLFDVIQHISAVMRRDKLCNCIICLNLIHPGEIYLRCSAC